MLEKLGFQSLLEETVTVKRVTKVMSWQQFVLGIVLGIYLGFSRLNQLRFIAQDPLLTGILKVSGLPPQSTLWRFLAALHLNVALQILSVQRQMRGTRVGGGQRAVEGGHPGHGHHRTHAVWQADGGTQELQPQE
jgi:hypothetical protein